MHFYMLHLKSEISSSYGLEALNFTSKGHHVCCIFTSMYTYFTGENELPTTLLILKVTLGMPPPNFILHKPAWSLLGDVFTTGHIAYCLSSLHLLHHQILKYSYEALFGGPYGMSQHAKYAWLAQINLCTQTLLSLFCSTNFPQYQHSIEHNMTNAGT